MTRSHICTGVLVRVVVWVVVSVTIPVVVVVVVCNWYPGGQPAPLLVEREGRKVGGVCQGK